MKHRKKIKDFVVEGEAEDGETILRLRKEIEERIMEDMRDRGYVPLIDILPQLFWEYDKESEHFNFTIIVYGTYMGKAKAKKILGTLDFRPIYFEGNK